MQSGRKRQVGTFQSYYSPADQSRINDMMAGRLAGEKTSRIDARMHRTPTPADTRYSYDYQNAYRYAYVDTLISICRDVDDFYAGVKYATAIDNSKPCFNHIAFFNSQTFSFKNGFNNAILARTSAVTNPVLETYPAAKQLLECMLPQNSVALTPESSSSKNNLEKTETLETMAARVDTQPGALDKLISSFPSLDTSAVIFYNCDVSTTPDTSRNYEKELARIISARGFFAPDFSALQYPQEDAPSPHPSMQPK